MTLWAMGYQLPGWTQLTLPLDIRPYSANLLPPRRGCTQARFPDTHSLRNDTGSDMGANHAGEKMRKKAKITAKIAKKLDKKADERAAAEAAKK